MPVRGRQLCACGCGRHISYSTQNRHLRNRRALARALKDILDTRRQSDKKISTKKRGEKDSAEHHASPPAIADNPDIRMDSPDGSQNHGRSPPSALGSEPISPVRPAGSDGGPPPLPSTHPTTRALNRTAAAHIVAVARGHWGDTRRNLAPRIPAGDHSDDQEGDNGSLSPDSDERESEEGEDEDEDEGWWCVGGELGDSQVPIQQQLSEDFYRRAASIGARSIPLPVDVPHSIDFQERMLSRKTISASFEHTLSKSIVVSPISHSTSSDLPSHHYIWTR